MSDEQRFQIGDVVRRVSPESTIMVAERQGEYGWHYRLSNGSRWYSESELALVWTPFIESIVRDAQLAPGAAHNAHYNGKAGAFAEVSAVGRTPLGYDGYTPPPRILGYYSAGNGIGCHVPPHPCGEATTVHGPGDNVEYNLPREP